MPKPSATITIEPLVKGQLVDLPMVPNAPNGKPQGRLLVEPGVEVLGRHDVLLRERDLHAVATEERSDGQTGLYL